MKQPDLTIRTATSDDKAAVLAFCRADSEHDYIHDVWDFWLEERDSTLLVGTRDGQPVALAHVLVRDGEGWFEGLRVDPALRGRGFGRQMLLASSAEARRLGASVLRLMTARRNAAMQTLLPQLGFTHCFAFDWYRAPALAPTEAGPRPRITPLPAEAADRLFAEAGDAPLLAETGGLYAYGWSFIRFTPAQLAEHLDRAEVFAVAADGAATPSGWAIVTDDGEGDDPMVALTVGDTAALLAALRMHPAAERHGEMRLSLPASGALAAQAQALGYTPLYSGFDIFALPL